MPWLSISPCSQPLLTMLSSNEKAGYCYQKEGKYDKALEKYSLALMIEARTWTLRKTGLCLRKLGRPGEALEAYRRAMQNEPDDLNTILMAAHCCLDTGNYEEALKLYFRVEYEKPGNSRVLRPIAWCYLVTGNYAEAEKYFERLSETGLTPVGQDQYGPSCPLPGQHPQGRRTLS